MEINRMSEKEIMSYLDIPGKYQSFGSVFSNVFKD